MEGASVNEVEEISTYGKISLRRVFLRARSQTRLVLTPERLAADQAYPFFPSPPSEPTPTVTANVGGLVYSIGQCGGRLSLRARGQAPAPPSAKRAVEHSLILNRREMTLWAGCWVLELHHSGGFLAGDRDL